MSQHQVLGPYELLKILGRGGMGTVYEAKDSNSGDIVAVKALAPAYSFDEHFRSRFEGEIDALMQLEHPNIVRLLSYGQDDGNLFFAMELVDGNSLFVEQKHGQVFSIPQVIDIALQILAGLRHAHDRGIIHRDLKPGNLMLDANHTVKIADFGIAKSFGSSHITNEGNVVGTMDFMAPEQARGRAVTVRSDLFSLGAVMYAMLTGKAPFLRDSIDATFESLLSQSPPPRLTKVVPEIPAELSKFVHKLLEKDPDKRFGTARAAENQLRYIVETIRETPQADTQVRGSTENLVQHDLIESDSADSTFVLSKQKSQPAKDTAKFPQRTKMASPDDQNATVETGVGDEPEPIPQATPDYFAKVTPQLRESRQKSSDDEPTETGNVWPVVIALVVVLGLISIGMYFAFKPKTAEQLLAIIDENAGTPNKVEPELDSFIRRFPDHDEIARIKELRRYAEAISHRNKLRGEVLFKRYTPSRIESAFLDVTRFDEIKLTDAFKKLSNFIFIYRNKPDLHPNDAMCIDNAVIFRQHLSDQINANAEIFRESIRESIDQANELASTDKDDALQLLYGLKIEYENEPWAKDLMPLVDEAINKIK